MCMKQGESLTLKLSLPPVKAVAAPAPEFQFKVLNGTVILFYLKMSKYGS